MEGDIDIVRVKHLSSFLNRSADNEHGALMVR